MRKEHYDLAVIGGGPAGSNTARLAATYDEDLDIAVFERGDAPSANCAGGLAVPFAKFLDIEPPDRVVFTEFDEIIIASPNNETSITLDGLDLSGIDWYGDRDGMIGWIFDRPAWDDWQLEQAGEAGADVRRKHVVKGVEQNGNVTLDVVDRENNEEIQVKSEYVALANGPNWELAKQAGFDEDTIEPSLDHLHMGTQYHMKDPEYFDKYSDTTMYLYLDRDYAPNGYVWSFPEHRGYTKWGNAVPLSFEENAKDCLDNYLRDTGKSQYLDTVRDKTNALIPTAEPLETCVHGNIALVGDTAHHCDPLHGGGMMFGSRAGKQLARAITNGDIGLYDEYWKGDFLNTLEHRFIIRDLIHNMDNSEYDRFVAAINGFEAQSLNPDKEVLRLLYHCLRSDPRIFSRSAAIATRRKATQILG